MKKNGFTLFEMLLVLMVVSTTLMLSGQAYTIQTDNYELRYFIKQFLSEIESAQNTAVISGKGFVVERKKSDGDVIYSFTQEGSATKQLVQPQSVTGPTFNSFWIKGGSGYIEPGTLTFQNDNLLIKISFQFVWGRYEVVETLK